jgi:hypothetical protein
VKNGLYEFCVSTIVEKRRLKDFYWDGRGKITEKKAWTQAKDLLDTAKQNGERMAVIFSGAAQDSETLLCWAVLEDIDIKGQSTECQFSNMRRINGQHGRQELVLKETGKPIKARFIKPYAICHTPEFIE